MSRNTPIWSHLFLLDERAQDLVRIPDEIFVDLQDSRGDGLLGEDLCPREVRESRTIGRSFLLLRVDARRREALPSRLGASARVYLVYHLRQEPDRRLLLGDQLFVLFRDGADVHERRSCLERYFCGIEGAAELPGGIYRLREELRGDPIGISRTIETESVVRLADPLFAPIPGDALARHPWGRKAAEPAS